MKNYKINKNYYNRNAEFYENSSWYYFNKYKNRQIAKRLTDCVLPIPIDQRFNIEDMNLILNILSDK